MLFASAARNVFRQVQDEEAYNLVFTAAAYVNTLFKELSAQKHTASQQAATPGTTAPANSEGGFIAVNQLEALEDQLKAKDLHTATNTSQRYLTLEHDPRALCLVPLVW